MTLDKWHINIYLIFCNIYHHITQLLSEHAILDNSMLRSSSMDTLYAFWEPWDVPIRTQVPRERFVTPCVKDPVAPRCPN